ncbi:11-beta-hydroxysteroid dehydrogenase-like 6 [Hibiscus syriacus]|uniref:11-beta-hydroxysteroid dehydrogenase-like 6 n=1 Tax=Hibiscus syriacus TaxID=106335 RepID=A0A6A3BPZ7_HIBSY|nr:11-beta-hydroxysteroid dehydrogenase-like 6 [Hibiscus syriacus]
MSLVSSAKALLEENVRGRVILITGASSGVGEHVAYEYARRGARLALVARRQGQLQQVGDVCEMSGSPEAVCIVGDVANIQDCKRFVDATVTHFGQLDHLVTNAGVTPLCLFEDYDDITKASPAMVITHQTNELTSFLKLPELNNLQKTTQIQKRITDPHNQLYGIHIMGNNNQLSLVLQKQVTWLRPYSPTIGFFDLEIFLQRQPDPFSSDRSFLAALSSGLRSNLNEQNPNPDRSITQKRREEGIKTRMVLELNNCIYLLITLG